MLDNFHVILMILTPEIKKKEKKRKKKQDNEGIPDHCLKLAKFLMFVVL